MNEHELRSAVEAILFAASDLVGLDDLVSALPGTTREEVERQVEEIRSAVNQTFGGFTLEDVGGGFRLATRPEMDPHLRKYFSRRNETRLSIAALETLAIVAYRQPITAPEVAEVRGVNSAGVLRTLLERKLVRIAGRKSVVGSPFLYRTTREFLVHFGLDSIQDLPKLDEFVEILGEGVQEELFGESPDAGNVLSGDGMTEAGDGRDSADGMRATDAVHDTDAGIGSDLETEPFAADDTITSLTPSSERRDDVT